MPSILIDHLDRMIEASPCTLSIEEICDFTFGGFAGRSDRRRIYVEIVAAGLELKKHRALPLAVPIPPDIGFFLIAWAAEHLADERVGNGDMGIDKVMRRLDKIERRHGALNGLLPWPADDAPPAWQAANREFERIHGALIIDSLRPHAPDMAELFDEDITEFDRRREIGRLNFAEVLGRDDLLLSHEDLLRDALAKIL